MMLDDFEVCTFCGEMFTGKKISEYKAHYEKCRTEYKDDVTPDNYDWEQDYY